MSPIKKIYPEIFYELNTILNIFLENINIFQIIPNFIYFYNWFKLRLNIENKLDIPGVYTGVWIISYLGRNTKKQVFLVVEPLKFTRLQWFIFLLFHFFPLMIKSVFFLIFKGTPLFVRPLKKTFIYFVCLLLVDLSSKWINNQGGGRGRGFISLPIILGVFELKILFYFFSLFIKYQFLRVDSHNGVTRGDTQTIELSIG